jgi:6-phosphogluconolactonase
VPLDLRVLDDAEQAAREVADELAAAARSRTQIAVAGGSTPRRAYEHAARLEPSWRLAGLWWGDERCVPPGDERSNYRLVRESLLDRIAQPPAVHRVRGELAPEEAAQRYDEEIRDVRLDLVLLGLGPDGHTASLFPGSPALEDTDRAAVAAEAGLEPFVPRVTLTRWKLGEAPVVLFLVTGEDKADAVALAFGGPPDPKTPASLVRSAEGTTVAVLDRAAASKLEASK